MVDREVILTVRLRTSCFGEAAFLKDAARDGRDHQSTARQLQRDDDLSQRNKRGAAPVRHNQRLVAPRLSADQGSVSVCECQPVRIDQNFAPFKHSRGLKMKVRPVLQPVLPDVPMTSPARTVSPTATSIRSR